MKKDMGRFVTILLVGLSIYLTIAFTFYSLFLQKPKTNFIGLFEIEKDLNTPQILYKHKGTSVLLRKGNLLALENKDIAIAIPTKLNLSPPFKSKSIESQLREKLFVTFQRKNPDKDSLIIRKMRDNTIESYFKSKSIEQKKIIAEDGFFVSRFSETLGGSSIYFIAGIPAKRDLTNPPSLFLENHKKIISNSVEQLCNTVAKEKDIKHLVLPIIGTGAAGIDEITAIDAILGGVNKAIDYKRAPKEISLIVFVTDSVVSNQRGASNIEKAAWFETGEAFRIVLNETSIYNEKFITWEYLRDKIWFFQLFSILLLPSFSLLIALKLKHKLPVRLTVDYVIAVWIKWATIVGGLFSLTGLQFKVNLPQPISTFALACIAAIIMPLIEWFKIGEPKDISKKGT